MAQDTSPFSPDEISSMFGQLQQSKPDAYGKMSIQDFSNLANSQSGTHMFDAGTAPAWTAPLRWPGQAISAVAAPFGDIAQKTSESLMDAAGLGKYAAPVGRAMHGLPEAAGTIGLGEATGGAWWLVPLLFGSETYAQTGSATAGLTSAATAGVLPGAGKVAGDVASKLGEKYLGGALPLIGSETTNVLQPLTEAAIREIGSTGTQLAINEGSSEAQSYERTGELYNPLTSDSIISALAGQLPWTGLSVYHSLGGSTYEGAVNRRVRDAIVREAVNRSNAEPVQQGAYIDVQTSPVSGAHDATVDVPQVKADVQATMARPPQSGAEDLGSLGATAARVGAEPEVNSRLDKDSLATQIEQKQQTTFPTEEGTARAVRATKSVVEDAINSRLDESTPPTPKQTLDLTKLTPDEQAAYVEGTRKVETTADPVAAQKEVDRTAAKLIDTGEVTKPDGTVIRRGDPAWKDAFTKQLQASTSTKRSRLYKTNVDSFDEWDKSLEGQVAQAQWRHTGDDTKEIVEDTHRANLMNAVKEDLSTPSVLKRLKIPGAVDDLDKAHKVASVVAHLTRDLSDPKVRAQSNRQLASDLGVERGSLARTLDSYKAELKKLPAFQDYMNGKAGPHSDIKLSPSDLFSAIARKQGWDTPFTERVSLVASKMVDTLRRFPSVDNAKFGLISSPSAIDQGIRGVFTSGQIGLSAEGRLRQQELDGMSALLTLGHETFHAIDADVAAGRANSTEVMTRTEMGKLAEAMTPEQRADVLRELHAALVPKDFLHSLPMDTQKRFADGVSQGAAYAARTPNEFTAELAGLLALGKASGDNPQAYRSAREAMDSMNYDAQSFSRMMFTNLSGVAHLLRAHFDARGLGMVDTEGGPITVGDAFTKLVNAYEDLTKPLPQTENALKSLQQQTSLSPTNIAAQWQNATDGKPWVPIIDPFQGSPEYSIIKPAADYFRERLGLEGKVGPVAANLVDILQPMVVGDTWPQTKPVWQLLGAAKGNATVHTVDVTKIMEGVSNKALSKVNAADSPGRAAFQALAEKQQRAEKDDGSLPVMPEDETRAYLGSQGFPQEAIDDAVELQKNAAMANAKNVEKVDEWGTNSIKNMVNFPMFQQMLPKTMAFEDVDRIATNFTQAFKEVTQVQDPTQKIALMAQKIEPLLAPFAQDPNNAAVLARIVKTNEDLFKVHNDNMNYLQSRPGWLSEVRKGDFLLSYKKDGEASFEGFETKAQRDAFIKSKQDQQGYSEFNATDRDPTNDTSWAFSNRIELSKILSTSLASLDAASASLPPDAAAKLREQINPVRDSLQELIGSGLRQSAMQRKGVRSETLDYLQGIKSYTNMVANMSEKQNVREQATNLFNSPGLKDQPNLVQKLQRNVEARLTAKEYSWIRDAKVAAAGYRLLYNPIADVWETGQIALTGVPGLMEGGPKTPSEGFLKASGRLTSAVMDFVSHTRAGLTKSKSPLPDDLVKAIETAETRGTFHKNPLQDYLGSYDADSLRALGDANGTAVEKGLHAIKADWLVNAVQTVGKVTSFIPEAMSKALFIAGYRRGVEHGLSPEDAAKEGEYSAQHGLPDVSVGQRPGMFVSGNKFWNSVGSTVYSGNAFMTAAYNMFTRAGIRAVKGEPGAVGTLVSLLALQQVAAGVFGQPGVQPVLGLLKQQFPQSNPEAKLQEIAKTFFAKLGADEPFANLLTDAAFHGAPRAVGAPYDAYRLFSLDQIGPFTPEGLQVGPHQLGRTAGIVGDFLHAITLASQGKYAQAAETAAPTPVNHVLETWRTQGKVLDAKGNLLYEPTAMEKIAGAAGLTPTKVAQLEEQRELQSREEDAATTTQNIAMEKLARQLNSGDVGGVRQQIVAMKQANPTLDVPSLVGELSSRAVNQIAATNPKNVTGAQPNMLERGKLFGLMPGQPASSMTEVQRLMAQSQLERSLGFAQLGRLNLQSIQTATRVDQIMQRDPSLTREEAHYLVERQTPQGARQFAVGSQ